MLYTAALLPFFKKWLRSSAERCKHTSESQSLHYIKRYISISGFEEREESAVRAQQLWGTSRSPCHLEQLKNPTNSLFFQEKAAAFLAHWGSFHYHKVFSVIKMYQGVLLSGWQQGDAGGICFWSLASAGALGRAKGWSPKHVQWSALNWQHTPLHAATASNVVCHCQNEKQL